MTAPDLVDAIRQRAVCIRWKGLPCTDYEVMADVLRIEGVRVPVSIRSALEIAEALAAQGRPGERFVALTPELAELVHLFAEVHPPAPAVTTFGGRDDWDAVVDRSRELDEWLQRRAWSFEPLVAPTGPEWVVRDSLGEQVARLASAPEERRWLRLVRVPPTASLPHAPSLEYALRLVHDERRTRARG